MKTYEAYAGNGHGHEHRRPTQIEHDLQAILGEMNETIRAIEERFSPSRMLGHVMEGARGVGHGSSEFAGNLGRAVRDNPVPAALIGIGVGALLFSQRREERPSEEGGPGISERLGEAKESAGEHASALKEKVSGALSDASERAHGAVASAKQKGHHTAESVRERAGDARDWITRTWDEQPLLLGVVCVALGAAIGASMPVSRRERRALGPLAEKAEGKLEQARETAAAKVQQATSSPGEDVDDLIR